MKIDNVGIQGNMLIIQRCSDRYAIAHILGMESRSLNSSKRPHAIMAQQ
jgi:hypothetical protein